MNIMTKKTFQYRTQSTEFSGKSLCRYLARRYIFISQLHTRIKRNRENENDRLKLLQNIESSFEVWGRHIPETAITDLSSGTTTDGGSNGNHNETNVSSQVRY